MSSFDPNPNPNPKPDIMTPCLVINQAKFVSNIRVMQRLVRGSTNTNLQYRPHAKAHKSLAIAHLQKEAGAKGFCCAKLGEAEVFMHGGVDDILITTQVVGAAKHKRLANLAKLGRIATVVDDVSNLRNLALLCEEEGVSCGVVIEVDVGHHRCGVAPDGEALVELAAIANSSQHLNFWGLQGYQGLIQMTQSYEERKNKATSAHTALKKALDRVVSAGIPVEILTGGGSGTSKLDSESSIYTEIQPGGYLFMDARYQPIQWDDQGQMNPFQQSLTVMSTVVSTPSPERCIVDMGLKAISSDQGPPVPLIKNTIFRFVGEEHGELSWGLGGVCPLKVGDTVSFVPTHCDTTVNLYDEFLVVNDEGEIVTKYNIDARGKLQ